ncbi:hypothetical protein EIP91_010357 [Steccherinum ochraceum]|uniref:Uncharacterized protein n=1 Tax=Steccherinum ochraceum TaxID=92696 RepID=A0A4R0R8L9_9APHY|nr:hypothetical protein EIP91_010357 [Steccherinum ochraceum]
MRFGTSFAALALTCALTSALSLAIAAPVATAAQGSQDVRAADDFSGLVSRDATKLLYSRMSHNPTKYPVIGPPDQHGRPPVPVFQVPKDGSSRGITYVPYQYPPLPPNPAPVAAHHPGPPRWVTQAGSGAGQGAG